MQHYQFAAACTFRGFHGFGNFVRIGHAGGDNHRFTGLGDIAYQRQIHHFERGDFIRRRVQAFQQIHRAEIERRAENGDALLAREIKQRLVPIPRHMRFLIQLVQRLAIPQRAANHKFRGAAVQRYRVGGVGLQLHRVRAAAFRLLDDFNGVFNTAVVIGRHFGNDVRRVIRANLPAVNADVCVHKSIRIAKYSGLK